ncbi:uncharacterized protein LOC143148911 [Ptiloglossa arizonensis]|uniref:uncharacterized protein LOC143148911 n=1 Tax=Ptiloglossa arizonensis TaxID=3350558 RepID=UPI003FA0C1C7
MGETFPVKHNSLSLKEHKLLEKESKLKGCCRCSLSLTVFCVITCCIFIIYWIILSPLLVNIFVSYNANKSDKWSVLYWIIAFLIWLFIMICLTLIWRCVDSKQNENIKPQSYGTNISASLTNVKYPQNVKTTDIKRVKSLNDVISVKDKTKNVHDKTGTNTSEESRCVKTKKHKDLPPLVIHRRNSGRDIEKAGTVNQKEIVDKDDGELKSGNEIHKKQKESMKDYLNLVTVTPDDVVDVESPKRSLSPRELFFIDLIREAEKAERYKADDKTKIPEGKYFFPHDFSSTEKDIANDRKLEKKKSIESSTSTAYESTYFIANVESPKSEKAEVYLEILPDSELIKQQPVNLNIEKTVFTSQKSSENNGNENTEEKVVFEI